jgi:hypothetical protein
MHMLLHEEAIGQVLRGVRKSNEVPEHKSQEHKSQEPQKGDRVS